MAVTPPTLPVLLTVAGRLAVVVGGGPVGRRKAAAVLAAGGRVRLVAPHPPPPGFAPAGLTWVPEAYRAEHLAGAALAFAAAPAPINALVVADAAAAGLWACDAADPGRGAFTLPAVVRAGGLTVAVGTGGAAPALARRVREKLEADFDAAFGVWVGLLADLRPEVKAAVPDPARRKAVFDALAGWHWLDRLRAGEPEAAVRDAMREVVRRSRGG